MKTRIVKYQCKDELGQTATFTADENGKQNSPSFNSAYDLFTWAGQAWNYAFKTEMVASNKNLQPR